MATPNADRLRAIDDWNPGLIEHTNQTLGKINGRLQTIAQVVGPSRHYGLALA